MSNHLSDLEKQIEAVLLFKNEPVSRKELAKIFSVPSDEIEAALRALENNYQDRGIVIVDNGEEVAFGTHPEVSNIVERIQKEELSRDLGKAGMETLAIVLYKGPVSRREIDFIRGVNSSFILRNLLIRGLIEREELSGERGFLYKGTLELLKYLGINRKEDLPEYETALKKIEKFVTNRVEDVDQ